jgi:hypothetical protein
MQHVDLSLNSLAQPLSAPRRLPRAIGWSLAAVVSAGLWYVAVEAVRLLF